MKRLEKKNNLITIPHELLEISRNDELLNYLLKEKPDYIIHTAAYGNMAHHQAYGKIVTSNIFGTFNLLRAAKDVPYKGFINFGTSSEYGKKDVPMTEDLLPETDTFYGASKIATTYLSRAFAKQFNKPVVTVRPFSVYGEFEAEYRFIPKIIHSLHANEAMDVDIEGIHDWIYINDFIDGIETVMSNIDKLQGQVVNIGTGVQTTNKQVIEYLERLSGKSLVAHYISNTRPNDSHMWIDGSTKLNDLGWFPKHTLEEGLKKVYSFYTYA